MLSPALSKNTCKRPCVVYQGTALAVCREIPFLIRASAPVGRIQRLEPGFSSPPCGTAKSRAPIQEVHAYLLTREGYHQAGFSNVLWVGRRLM
jgi:hypothetical protein